MTEFTEFDRLASVCRLEIGCNNFGNMLQNDNVITICTRMRFLTSLKLVFCHLITFEMPLLCQGTPGGDRLQELVLCKTRCSPSALSVGFPNLTELRIVNCECAVDDQMHLKHLQRLVLIEDGNVSFDCPNLTHVWLRVGKKTSERFNAWLSKEATPRLLRVVWDDARWTRKQFNRFLTFLAAISLYPKRRSAGS
jgi:hypothetical protein